MKCSSSVSRVSAFLLLPERSGMCMNECDDFEAGSVMVILRSLPLTSISSVVRLPLRMQGRFSFFRNSTVVVSIGYSVPALNGGRSFLQRMVSSSSIHPRHWMVESGVSVVRPWE